jgi:thymidylate kinase
LLWFVDLWVGYWVKLKPKMVRSTLILFDRYIHDLQVDRRRYRFAGPQWWPRLLGKLSPQPDLWILLDAPPEVLWRRKAELTREESARQREAYRQFITGNRNAAMIDANQPPEMVVAAVCSEVFRRLETRTAERYSLPRRDLSR